MTKQPKIMTQEEIKYWITRWEKLSQGPIRDMVIKIWSKSLKQPKQ